MVSYSNKCSDLKNHSLNIDFTKKKKKITITSPPKRRGWRDNLLYSDQHLYFSSVLRLVFGNYSYLYQFLWDVTGVGLVADPGCSLPPPPPSELQAGAICTFSGAKQNVLLLPLFLLWILYFRFWFHVPGTTLNLNSFG